jgi:hypothetical protein
LVVKDSATTLQSRRAASRLAMPQAQKCFYALLFYIFPIFAVAVSEQVLPV